MTPPAVDPPSAARRSPLLLLSLAVPAVAVVLVVLVALTAPRRPSQHPVPDESASLAPPPHVTIYTREQRLPAPTDAAPLVAGIGTRGLGDLRGRIVVLNFWASWCAPCATEQPELTAAHRQLEGRQVAFLGVSVRDAPGNARAYWQQAGAPYDSLLDPDVAYSARFQGVGPTALPLTLFIDRSGHVAARIFGPTTAPEATSIVQDLLAEAP